MAKMSRRNRSEKHQNFSEGVPAGQVRGKCRITSCQFTAFSCTEDLHPERFFRVNIRSDNELEVPPHLFVADDLIWVFTPLTVSGVHSPSWNSITWGVEMVGNFDTEDFQDGPGAAVRKN